MGAVAGGLLLIILGVVGTALWFLGSTLVQQFCYFIEHYGFYAGKMELFLDQCCRSMSGVFGMEAGELESLFVTRMATIAENIERAVCTETDGKFMGVCQNDHRSGRGWDYYFCVDHSARQ